MDGFRSGSMFCVVNFVGGRKRAVVPDTWLSVNETHCLLPPKVSDSDLDVLVRNLAEPGQGWQMLEVSSQETFGSYYEAKKQLEKSKETSEASSQRKRKKPSYLEDYSTPDSDGGRKPFTVFGVDFDEEAMSENEWVPPPEFAPRIENVSTVKKTSLNDTRPRNLQFNQSSLSSQKENIDITCDCQSTCHSIFLRALHSMQKQLDRTNQMVQQLLGGQKQTHTELRGVLQSQLVNQINGQEGMDVSSQGSTHFAQPKPWEVSANDYISTDTTSLETPHSGSGFSSDLFQNNDKLTSASPEKGSRSFDPWPVDFAIPTSQFSESLKREAVSGCLSWSSKSELLKIIADKIFMYTSNPSQSQRDVVARQLIKEYPSLQSNIGEGHEGWAQKIYDRVKNEARKRGIFSHKRKNLNNENSTLEYSRKVQKTLAWESLDLVTNLGSIEKMVLELEKVPESRSSKIILEGLKATYKERRGAIDSNILMADLKNLFPALFTVLGINYDFNVLYNIDLQKVMYTSLQVCSSAVEGYAKKKMGESLLNMPSIGENINDKIILTVLLIPEILGENPDFLYKKFPSESSMHDFTDTHVTPHVCVVGDSFSSTEVFIVAEKKTLIECSDFIEGIATLIGLYLVVNIEYPKEAMATFKFFQSYILKFQCKNLPGKLIKFCNSLP